MRLTFTLALLLAALVARAGENAIHFAALVTSLDRSQPEAACRARDGLRQWFRGAETKDRASMFRSFRLLLGQVGGQTTNDFEEIAVERGIAEGLERLTRQAGPSKLISISRTEPAVYARLGRWLDCGFLAISGEGIWDPMVDNSAYREFLPGLPLDLRTFMEFQDRESREQVGGDGAIFLSWKQLADRLLRWEGFGRRYPKLLETGKEVKPEISRLERLLLFGFDNTPTYVWGNGKILPAVIQGWRSLVRDRRPARIKTLLAELVRGLTINGDVLGPRDRELCARYGFSEEFDRWLETVNYRIATAGQATK